MCQVFNVRLATYGTSTEWLMLAYRFPDLGCHMYLHITFSRKCRSSGHTSTVWPSDMHFHPPNLFTFASTGIKEAALDHSENGTITSQSLTVVKSVESLAALPTIQALKLVTNNATSFGYGVI